MAKIRGLFRPSYTLKVHVGCSGRVETKGGERRCRKCGAADPANTETRTEEAEGFWLRYSVKGKRYRVNLADHAGGRPVRDRRVAERMAGRILAKSDEKRAGLVDPVEEHARTPIDEHVEAFETAFKARDVVEEHRDRHMLYVRAFVASSGVATVAELNGVMASEWLESFRASGLGARSVNARRAALRQFGHWLVRERRLAFDPFVSLERLNEDADKRRPRRALTPAELSRLLDVARTRPLADALKPRKIRSTIATPRLKPTTAAGLVALGKARALVYTVAAGTGLRRGELSRLRWLDVDLARKVATIPAGSAKSRCEQFIDLRSDLVAALEAFKPKDVNPAALVFPGDVFPTLRTFKLDLVAAGLATRDARGEVDTRDPSGAVLDFHCLRTTLGSHLALNGVHPAVAQKIMRHSTVELTMKHYTDTRILDTRGALERLAPPAPEATGGKAAAGA